VNNVANGPNTAVKAMTNLDGFDRKILEILQEEGRITTLQLSERVGLSPTPCARRVKQLEDDGYIDRYVALLNAARLGVRLNVFVSIRLRSQTRDAFDRFDEEIKHMPEIVGCYLLTGSFDYLLQVRVSDVDAFRDFMRSRLTAIEGVIETQSSIVLQQLKATPAIPLTAHK
jgi:DNA-binding Lrp family transcriptional regulator